MVSVCPWGGRWRLPSLNFQQLHRSPGSQSSGRAWSIERATVGNSAVLTLTQPTEGPGTDQDTVARSCRPGPRLSEYAVTFPPRLGLLRSRYLPTNCSPDTLPRHSPMSRVHPCWYPIGQQLGDGAAFPLGLLPEASLSGSPRRLLSDPSTLDAALDPPPPHAPTLPTDAVADRRAEEPRSLMGMPPTAGPSTLSR